MRVFSISLKCIHNEAEFEAEHCCLYGPLALYFRLPHPLFSFLFSLMLTLHPSLSFSSLICLYLFMSPCLLIASLAETPAPHGSAHFSFQILAFFQTRSWGALDNALFKNQWENKQRDRC